jgi:hypothetical protein
MYYRLLFSFEPHTNSRSRSVTGKEKQTRRPPTEGRARGLRLESVWLQFILTLLVQIHGDLRASHPLPVHSFPDPAPRTSFSVSTRARRTRLWPSVSPVDPESSLTPTLRHLKTVSINSPTGCSSRVPRKPLPCSPDSRRAKVSLGRCFAFRSVDARQPQPTFVSRNHTCQSLPCPSRHCFWCSEWGRENWEPKLSEASTRKRVKWTSEDG